MAFVVHLCCKWAEKRLVRWLHLCCSVLIVVALFLSGLLCLRGRRRIPLSSDVWTAHCCACRWIRRVNQFLSEPRLLWGADLSDGGSLGPGASAHGHVHRAGNLVLQIQTHQDERTSRAILVKGQHTKGNLIWWTRTFAIFAGTCDTPGSLCFVGKFFHLSIVWLQVTHLSNALAQWNAILASYRRERTNFLDQRRFQLISLLEMG